MSYTCFAENAIQLAKDEDKLFESLLAIDFRKVQLLKEADLDAQTDPDEGEDVKTMDYSEGEAGNDATKKKIFENILKKLGEKVDKILEWLKNALAKVAEKFKEFFYKDSKIVKTFAAALKNNEALKGFPGIKDFAPANLDAKLPLDEMGKLGDDFAAGKFVANEGFVSQCKELEQKCAAAVGEKVELWNADGNANYNFDKAVNILATNQLTKDIFGLYKKFSNIRPGGALNKGYVNAANASAAKNNVDDSTRQMTITAINAFGDAAKKFVDTYVVYFKSLRQALIVCGTYAAKHNESLTWLVDTQSAQYLDEQFAFI